MRFWCSVSDRCSGKIGEGEVPPAQLQLCLLSLFGTKGSCHIRHDWCSCRRIVRAYLHETPEGEPTPAGRFVSPLFALHTPHPSARQARMLQHNPNQFTFLGMIHHAVQALWSSLPTYPSLSRVIAEQICLGEDHTAQNISTRHLPLVFVSSSYHTEMLMMNDVLRRNHFNILDNEEH